MQNATKFHDFEKGIIVGYYRNGRFCQNVFRNGRATKLRDRARQVLSKKTRKTPTKPIVYILQELQQVSGSVVFINIIHKEAHLLGSHGHYVVHKRKQILWSDDSRLNLYELDGKVQVWRTPRERLLPECILSTVKFGGGGIMVGDVSSGIDWDP
ncbi:transposable element Tc1 transposase [Trichonephila clavipes]|nr:transposable element Tc1 transposase [Trichonephila clavipes]